MCDGPVGGRYHLDQVLCEDSLEMTYLGHDLEHGGQVVVRRLRAGPTVPQGDAWQRARARPPTRRGLACAVLSPLACHEEADGSLTLAYPRPRAGPAPEAG